MKTFKNSLIFSAIILIVLFISTKWSGVIEIFSTIFLGLLYVLVFNKYGTVCSKPLFNANEKFFKRFCIIRIVLFVIIDLLFITSKYLLEAMLNDKSGLIIAFVVLIECLITYLIFASKRNHLFKTIKPLFIVLGVSVIISIISGIAFSELMVMYNEKLNDMSGAENMMGFLDAMAVSDAANIYRTIAYDVCMIQKWMILSLLVVFHAKINVPVDGDERFLTK